MNHFYAEMPCRITTTFLQCSVLLLSAQLGFDQMTHFIPVIKLLINNESLLMTNNLIRGNLSKLLRFHLHIVLLAHFGLGKILPASIYSF